MKLAERSFGLGSFLIAAWKQILVEQKSWGIYDDSTASNNLVTVSLEDSNLKFSLPNITVTLTCRLLPCFSYNPLKITQWPMEDSLGEANRLYHRNS